jgi:putative acetyltransferase
MILRRATADDAPALAKAHVDSWHAAYRGIVPESFLSGFTEQRRTAGFGQALAAGAEETYLVEQDGEVPGFLTVGACRDSDLDHVRTGEIWGIYVGSRHWRKGIGRFLCRRGEEMLRSRGHSVAVLWVLEKNVQARRFYEAMGYVSDGASKQVNLGTPLTVIRYRKELGPAILIRPEQPQDLADIRTVNERAFGQPQEANIVDKLRRSCEGLLSLVAAAEDRVVGHILFSPVVIESSGSMVHGMGLAPMAVLPEYQRKGIGSKLVRSGLDALRERPCPFVIVLGHSEYYPRFGFQPASRYGLRCQWEGVPDEAFMILILDQSTMQGTSGIARYRREFDEVM